MWSLHNYKASLLYLSIIVDSPTMLHPGGNGYSQDNATNHHARMDWGTWQRHWKSTDLNPVMNRIHNHSLLPTCLNKLLEILMTEWSNIPRDNYQHFVESSCLLKPIKPMKSRHKFDIINLDWNGFSYLIPDLSFVIKDSISQLQTAWNSNCGNIRMQSVIAYGTDNIFRQMTNPAVLFCLIVVLSMAANARMFTSYFVTGLLEMLEPCLSLSLKRMKTLLVTNVQWLTAYAFLHTVKSWQCIFSLIRNSLYWKTEITCWWCYQQAFVTAI